ncbi:PDT-domain-containing protein [Dothidotthia symphoricarpi CBS 119687]|uniref:prephenate dehydratase n=1 Tax=Dothidotthia symphoricarpi CBS 119687 TaxID=1392245 RepID=A0A6A6AAN4_9PLEO|nr:PDT-domain-containing protein [Dothidotthia symphoricarpi CBS 119687]KAF2128616.1 PDT-domain-containing protein [Dothidotthia symphoricarpi CBS 119687]
MAEQDTSVVAFLGPEASYTHQAALNVFPPTTKNTNTHNDNNTPTHTLTPHPTIQSIFAAVQSGTAHHGIVPFENSTNGSVVFTLDLFADLEGKYPDILVCGETYVGVRHCLLGYRGSSSSSVEKGGDGVGGEEEGEGEGEMEGGNPFQSIKTLFSHPQAWTQCTSFLDENLAHARREDTPSTSRAAQLVAADPSGTSAALSSAMAAGVFGLDVLASNIEDRVGNTTRFLVLRKSGSSAMLPPQGMDIATPPLYKSLITFTVAHGVPGALAQCLAVFGRHGLDLTSINTRPGGGGRWEYVFFVENLLRCRELEKSQF